MGSSFFPGLHSSITAARESHCPISVDASKRASRDKTGSLHSLFHVAAARPRWRLFVPRQVAAAAATTTVIQS